MKTILLVLLLTVFTSVKNGGAANTALATTTVASSNATTMAPTVTTAAPNVTTAAPNVTTAAPNVTTAAPNVTTAAPNVTTAAPNVTTASPNVSTTTGKPAPTTPGTPPTTSTPTAGTYHVTGEDKNICILMKIGVKFSVRYNNTHKIVNGYMNMPSNANVSSDSSCKSNVTDGQRIVLTWEENNSLSFTFVKKDDKRRIDTVSVILNPDEKSFPGYTGGEIKFSANKTLFEASKSRSYECKASQDYHLGHGVVMSTTNVQVESFRDKTDTKFDLAEVCNPDDKTSNIVPIAVGCALAALVLIVLIAYCIGRRRSRQKGYQSV